MISRYQLGFLLCLKDLFQIEVKIYDPVFTEADHWLLRQFGCEILTENFEGKYRIRDKHTTIFYMPHCPKQLTNNLIWANWGLNLNSCIIIANSFNSIIENSPKRVLNQNQYLVKIFPHVLELAVINSFKFFEIFNDTAIHIFPWNKIKLLSGDFWEIGPEPNYDDDDIEFVRVKV
nr:PREDICTED: SRR1-like protein [Tribolium castaneum]|eukprot:XP_008197568.1 PREDICTED: SRR1-like protein [Tribolium castaneum]